MSIGGKRKRGIALIVITGVVAGAVAAIATLVADTERVTGLWARADVSASGTATVTEVIDYDFGYESRHGIFRDVPDLDESATIVVSSETAPDQFVVSGSTVFATRIKIGDPGSTISQRHRYLIQYPLDTLVRGDVFSWNAVGTGWPVPVNSTEIHIVSERELVDLQCSKGSFGDSGGCTAETVEPGHVVVEVKGLGAEEGVTIDGRLGAELAFVPAAPAPPAGSADDPGVGWFLTGLVAFLAALGAGLVGSRYIRHLGREQVWHGGAADAAFAPGEDSIAGYRLLDHEELGELATIEFEAPRGLSAAAGGIIDEESVESRHMVAWIMEAAIRGELELDGDDEDLALVRGQADPHPASAETINALFANGPRVELGEYDKDFATVWKDLEQQLEEWRKASGLWDPAGRRRRRWGWIIGGMAFLAGIGITILGGVAATRWGAPWLIVVALGGVLFGVAAAGLFRSWELLVRTPEGSARWLQIESFRRFMAGSEARHAEAAARMGLLRQYTAWAVALDQLDHWNGVVEEAAVAPGSAVSGHNMDYRFVAVAPLLASATSKTSVAPSSSSSGGFGGGSVGGGGGGGGGGSW